MRHSRVISSGGDRVKAVGDASSKPSTECRRAQRPHSREPQQAGGEREREGGRDAWFAEASFRYARCSPRRVVPVMSLTAWFASHPSRAAWFGSRHYAEARLARGQRRVVALEWRLSVMKFFVFFRFFVFKGNLY